MTRGLQIVLSVAGIIVAFLLGEDLGNHEANKAFQDKVPAIEIEAFSYGELQGSDLVLEHVAPLDVWWGNLKRICPDLNAYDRGAHSDGFVPDALRDALQRTRLNCWMWSNANPPDAPDARFGEIHESPSVQ